MKIIAALVAIGLTLTVVVNLSLWNAKRDAAVRTLQEQHNIEVTSIGYAWFGCGRDDEFTFKWEGVNEHGNTVKGNACAGTFKGTTIRFK